MIKNLLSSIALSASAILLTPNAEAADFASVFNDSTLRIDYVFGGSHNSPQILLDAQSKTAGWAGRRSNLDKLHLPGNGTIKVVDPATGTVLYQNSFSSLFQEWLVTPEADSVARAFENTFLVPLPKKAADIVLTLTDNRHRQLARFTHRYDPADELVATRKKSALPSLYLHRGTDPEKAIDVAIVAEGYTAGQDSLFYAEAGRMVDEILSYQPFSANKQKFNFIAVMSPSSDSGVSVPLEGLWPDTAFGSHFSTFHSARYLTTPRLKSVHDALSGIPYEHVIVLANTDRYGGGGIFNSYLMATTRNRHSLPVVVHEFGHSFGGLADEYFYTDEEDESYPLDVEPWEPNITTLVDFPSKWQKLVTPGTPVPTPEDCDDNTVGAFEGGGYRSKGVYRPVKTCRMRDNYHPTFCPVCEASLSAIIDFYTNPD